MLTTIQKLIVIADSEPLLFGEEPGDVLSIVKNSWLSSDGKYKVMYLIMNTRADGIKKKITEFATLTEARAALNIKLPSPSTKETAPRSSYSQYTGSSRNFGSNGKRK